MLFSSMKFIFIFVPIFFVMYYLCPSKWRNLVAFIGSILFYCVGELHYIPLLLFAIIVHFYLAQLIERTSNRARRKLYLSLGLGYSFGMLFVFKYFTFLAGELGIVFTNLGIPGGQALVEGGQFELALPLGISFYTFQIVAYLIDVYRDRINAEHNILYLGTYLCLFPQLIAGPIVLYPDMVDQMKHRTYSLNKFESGLKYFTLGLASKMLLANVMGTLWSSIQRVGYGSVSTPLAWIGMFAFSFQIYFDFNGYSLMAIGLGKMLGFTIPKNFNNPYISRSVGEFWRRWHITLGTWFKEYVYFPLGGNRGSTLRTVFNLLIVWTLTGIWHGAGWNFVLWGFSLFLFIALEKIVIGPFLGKHKVISHVYLLIVIPMTWMLFAIESLGDIGAFFSRLVPFFTNAPKFQNAFDFVGTLHSYWPFLILCIIGCTTIPEKLFLKYQNSKVGVVVLTILFWISIWQVMTSVNNPFLYFRF